jgi:hypothetical protein
VSFWSNAISRTVNGILNRQFGSLGALDGPWLQNWRFIFGFFVSGGPGSRDYCALLNRGKNSSTPLRFGKQQLRE